MIEDLPVWCTWEMSENWSDAIERARTRNRLITMQGRAYMAHQYVYWSRAHKKWIISNLDYKGDEGYFKRRKYE